MKIEIYTDGSTRINNKRDTNNLGGFGVIVYIDSRLYTAHSAISYNTTNNREELKALLYALKNFGLEWNNFEDSCIIYSDSAYAINSCLKWRENWEKNGWISSSGTPVVNQDIIKEFANTYKLKQAFFIQVKGHSGILGNELADQLAHGDLTDIELLKKYR